MQKIHNEAEVRAKFIDPALKNKGWDFEGSVSLEYSVYKKDYEFSDGRIEFVGGKTRRGSPKKCDYLLFIPKTQTKLAIIEAKSSYKPKSEGLQQAKDYAKDLDVKFVYASNGSGFVEFDFFTGLQRELDEFPTPEELKERYLKGRNASLTTPITKAKDLLESSYFLEKKSPRYYQANAINRTIEAIANGQRRILLVMATGTGKTYTAFQIAHRLYRAKVCKKILYLADRNILIDQSLKNDFASFKNVATKITKRTFNPAYELYFGIYQQFIGIDSNQNQIDYYKAENGGFGRDFFDLIFIDECHRGSAKEDSTWREILEYFSSAIQIGLTATPNIKQVDKTNKQAYEKNDKIYISSNLDYFGEPIYTYSLKQGISDGFLAPYRVCRSFSNLDIKGYRPEHGKRDKYGNIILNEVYESPDFNRTIYIDELTKIHAQKITQFLLEHFKSDFSKGQYPKTIVFCEDKIHALDMRDALIAQNPAFMRENANYIMRITGDDTFGKSYLEQFISTKETYPAIVTTSKLLTTGVDTQMVKLIVIDKNISSLSEFKQIIGRGTRLVQKSIKDEKGDIVGKKLVKDFFYILDFKNATKHFANADFDGDFSEFEIIDSSNEAINKSDKNDSGESQDSGESKTTQPRLKFFVNGVDCYFIYDTDEILDAQGNLIASDLKAYTNRQINSNYKSLKDFLSTWDKSARKQEILEMLESQGILVDELRQKEEFKDMDEFDIILHLGFNQIPLSRTQRAKKAQKFLANFTGKARQVLEILLDKYAKYGIKELESSQSLKVEPFKSKFGDINDIMALFGDTNKYISTINALKTELYKAS